MINAELGDGLPPGRRGLAAITVLAMLTMSIMDSSIANVALPSIARTLHSTDAQSIWIVNSYQIALAVGMLPLASVGEVVGYRRVSQAGLIVFTIASLLCGTSSTILGISIARVLQGLGAAGIMSVNNALIRFIYPKDMLGRAVSYNALCAGAAGAIGPSIAGAVLSFTTWHWLFFGNIPFGILLFVASHYTLPATPKTDRPYDYRSAAFCMMFIGELLYTIDAIGHREAFSHIAIYAMVAIILFICLLKSQADHAPMFPVDLLRIRLFALSICTSISSFSVQATVLLTILFLLQVSLGRTAAVSGLVMTGWPVAIGLTALFAGQMANRVSAGLMGSIGLVILGGAMLSMFWIDGNTASWSITLRLLVGGFGFGLFQSPNNRAIVGSAPKHRAGGASGMLGTSRLTGQSIGASITAFWLYGNAFALQTIFIPASILSVIAALVSSTRIKHQLDL
ncbi:MFS transporter [Paraburkholderia xenovorans]